MASNLLDIQDKWSVFQRIRMEFNNCTLVVPIVGTTNTLIFAYNMPKSSISLAKIQSIPLLQQVVWDKYWGWVGQVRT